MPLKLKPTQPTLKTRLQSFETTLTTLSKPSERWKSLRAIAKQQAAEAPARLPPASADEPGPIWIQRMETLFGPPDEQLRVIRCENCGLQTREVRNRVCITHKVECEKLKQAGMLKKMGHLGLDLSSKKRASSEVSLESTHPPSKKKKTTIIDHTTPTTTADLSTEVHTMTKKQLKKALAQAERLEREKERKERKAREEEAKKANQKKMGRIKGGPVNVNEQCGVLIPPHDIPCARSLTCKTHSMGAKRGVLGRSDTYDILLNEWQKKHNPNWGDRKVVTPRVGPGIEPGVSKKKKKKKEGSGAQTEADGMVVPTAAKSKPSAKEREKDKTGTKSKSGGGTAHSKSTGGGGGGGGGAHGGSKKKDPNHRNRAGEGKRPTGEKMTAANEAKLLGEIDEDFGFSTSLPHPPGAGPDEMEMDGMRPEEEEIDHQSDLEMELIVKGIVASRSGQPLVASAMGSAWVTPRWSKFGKLGVKETFRDAFRGKM